MGYFYLAFPFIVWVVSQTIKFLIRLGQSKTPVQLKNALWVYLWAGGAPSTHTAIITSSLVLVWNEFGFSPIFTFCLAITLLLLYNLVLDRKNQELLNKYYKGSSSETLKKIVQEGFILDLAGHTFNEVFWGAILGIALGAIAVIISIAS